MESGIEAYWQGMRSDRIWLRGRHYGRLSAKRQAAIEADMHRGRHVQMTVGRQRLGRLSGNDEGRH